MQISALPFITVVLIVLQCIGGGVCALSPALKQLRLEFDAEDPQNKEWLNKVHEQVNAMTDEDTFLNDENKRDDEGRPPELDVIELTDQSFKEIFNGKEPPQEIWYVAFVKRKRSQP